MIPFPPCRGPMAPPPPPQHQHQHQQPPPFAQQAAPASSPAASMPGGMRLSFDQMSGKAPGEQHHHSAPMLYAASPQSAAGAGAAGAPGANVLGMGELMRKKRGRPRKYAPDGSMALALAPISSASAGGAAAPGQQQHGGFSISSPPSDPNAKRRGRPPGSGKKKQFEALGTCFSPVLKPWLGTCFLPASYLTSAVLVSWLVQVLGASPSPLTSSPSRPAR